MERQKLSTFGLMSILVIVIVFISGCVQEEIPTKFNKTLIEDKMLIGAYYYPWYNTNQHWPDGYKGSPVLGEYSSRNQTVISKHIDWASDYGIDFFLLSWWGANSQDNWEDTTVKDYFLKSNDINYIKFAILYESLGRLKTNENEKIDFNNPDNKKVLIEDFLYLSKTYFSQKQYLKIDNKPVVFIYLAREFAGDYEGAITALRSELRKQGYELYLIGDQVYWQSPFEESEKKLMKQFDAVTSYNMHTSVPDIAVNFVEKVSDKYKEWFEVTSSFGIDFIPNIMPGFDDTAIRPEAKNPVISRDTNLFRHFSEEARKYLSDKNIILITSWNEWHEYTQIEPDQNYSESYLEVIKQTLTNYR